MGHEQQNIRHNTELQKTHTGGKHAQLEDFVLEKSIFNNIFEKDIRRVFIYKKSERLAKAIHLIAPAFTEAVSLRNRIDAIAIGLVDAAMLPSGAARLALSRELLALSSVLSMARTGGLLSPMNAELIANEAHILLQEVADYEEPRLFLDDSPTLSGIAKKALSREPPSKSAVSPKSDFGQSRTLVQKDMTNVKDISDIQKDRRGAVLSVIKNKGRASIKDISTVIRGVSEKTIQRELLSLIAEGVVLKQGERRWSTYSLATNH